VGQLKEGPAEAPIRDIKRKTRRKYSTEEKIRIVIEELRDEQSIGCYSLAGSHAVGLHTLKTYYV
jgi:transposase-like protein